MTLPPGPKTPQWLRTLKLTVRPLDYMDAYSQRYGDCFTVGSPEFPIVYFSHPQAIEALFTAPPEQFLVGQSNRILRFLMGDRSLLMLDGQPHQRQRRLLMPPFHGDRLRAYSQLICDVTEKVTAHWEVEQPFVVRSAMQEITLRVILQAVFGVYSGARYEELRRLLSQLLDSMSSPLRSIILFFPSLQQDWGPLSPWGRFLRMRQQIEQLLYAEIGERRRGNLAGNDILTLLMSAVDENGQPMSDRELHDELMTLLVAGHETTASALSWALYWLHQLPEVQERLRDELDSVADLHQIARLPYLSAVCSETLRIYPIALTTFPRVPQVPFRLMDYEIPPGTALIPCIYLTHHREEIYPEPQRFRPERFLERQYSPYEYLPFGGGNRRCIGQALALLEMKLVLSTVLTRFHLALTNSRPVQPVRRGLAIAPPPQLRMVVTDKLGD